MIKGRLFSFLKKVKYTTFLAVVAFLVPILFFLVFQKNIENNNYTFESTFPNAILTILQVVVMVYVTSTDRENGYRLSRLFLWLHVAFLIFVCVLSKSVNLSIGIATLLLGLLMIYIVNRNIEIISWGEKKLYRLAYSDALTELPNRQAFEKEMKEVISENDAVKFAFVIVDLDNFKGINDTIGHQCGDSVLVEISKRWRKIRKPNEFVFRQGGDEFIIILKGMDDKEALIKRLGEYQDALAEKMKIGDNVFFVNGSFGVSVYPHHSKRIEILFKYADLAMYEAKKSKMSKIKIYDSSMTVGAENEYTYDRLIRRNLSNNSFELFFQPQFKGSDHSIRGFETLLRMKDDNGRYVNVEDFIAYAEKSRLILDIDKWVMKNAVRAVAPYIKKMDSSFVLAVNVSAQHLQDDSLYNDICKVLDETCFPPECLEIEITETSVISSVDSAAFLLKKIKSLGVKIAMDDFGTGHASMNNLSELPIDLLKIDKVFIERMMMNKKYKSFIAAIVSLGHIFNFEVISEGVEYQVQLDMLNSLNCDYIQGFFWGRPMPKSELESFIKKTVKRSISKPETDSISSMNASEFINFDI